MSNICRSEMRPETGKGIISDRGFTLLEVLVAMALMVILSGALYGTYFSLMRGRETAVAKMETRRELAGTLDQMRRELSASFYSNANKKLHFVVEDRDYFGKPASTLDFTAIVSPRSGNLRESDQAQIEYRTVEKDGKLLLVRQVKDLRLVGDPFTYPQMEELEGFLVECHDGGKWVRNWDTRLNLRLPRYVKVTFKVKEGEKTVEFSAIAAPRMGS